MTSVGSASSESVLPNAGSGDGNGAGGDGNGAGSDGKPLATGSASTPEGVRKLGRGASEGRAGGKGGGGGGGSAGGGVREVRDGGGGGKPGTTGRWESASDARCIAFSRV